jgi:hypothetical protein
MTQSTPKLTDVAVEKGKDRLALLRSMRESDHYFMNIVDNETYFPG